MIGKWHGLVMDCSSPSELAKFYEQVLGYMRVYDDPDWVVIGITREQPGIAFQKIENYKPSTWPTDVVPTQMHLDVKVDDLQVGLEQAEAIGAKLLNKSSDTFWVLADPEGHPFCLVKLDD